LLGSSGSGLADPTPQGSKSRTEAVLQNILTLDRPGEDGFATIWDGNKYVQCGRSQDRSLRCEAAGALLQPSLRHVLVPERVTRLTALGWRLDPSFGNYVQTFPPSTPTSQIADKILQALAGRLRRRLGRSGGAEHLGGQRALPAPQRAEPEPCRNRQQRALHGGDSLTCLRLHAPEPDLGPSLPAGSTAELIGLYGARVTGEIQRLRVNIDRHVFVVLETDIGYVRCGPQSSPAAIYCEAQSADSWPALASVLTPDRIARLHAAGFADPGRAPNYWKIYPADQIDDATLT
jgi:hypothetical protein